MKRSSHCKLLMMLLSLSLLLFCFSFNFSSRGGEVVLSYNMSNLERGNISEIMQENGFQDNVTLMVF
ncbi:MAG TPA: hypothetical protein GX004_07415 [Firmicutes bacterium]|nr:hypothetical protein [Bacillota bacterium]